MSSESAAFDRNQVADLLEKDLNFLSGFCIPDIFKYFFPKLYLVIWDLISEAVRQEKGLLKLAIGLPRGFVKTTFLKLYVVYCVLFTSRNFILIVCNTEALALNFIADVSDILDSINIRNVFGDWSLGKEKDTQSQKKFGFRGRDIIISGIGVGTSMRGLNLKFRRPDVIIMDDMQSREDAENKKVADEQIIWMLGTLLKARSYERCLFLYSGNMYPFEGCILRKLKYDPTWISFICGAILANGESLWPELRPIADLLQELESDMAMGHPEVFYSEVLNDEEAGTVSGVDTSKIPVYPTELDGVEPQGGFIIIDPASGKKQGNDVAIGVFFIYDGIPVLRLISIGKYSPMETIHQALKLAFTLGIKLIAVESNSYQFTLIYWFEHVMQQIQGSGIDFVELYAGQMTKNAKIKEMLASLLKGEILLHPEVRSLVVNQIVHWNPLRTNNVDDILDLLAWVHKCIALYGTMMEIVGSVDLKYDQGVESAHTEDLALTF